MGEPPPNVDTVVLDLDGVIVDVSDSYRKAIIKTLEHSYGDSVPRSAIQSLKDAGGFNNDWNVTYALAFFVLGRQEGLDMDVEEWTRKVADQGGGLRSAKMVVDDTLDTAPLGKVYEQWNPDELREVFQQLYLGAELYRRIEDTEPELETDGYILSEPVILNDRTTEFLTERYEVGILTGRPSIEAKIALRRAGVELPEEMVFTMDDWPGEKPHPGALLSLADEAGSEELIFVGDTLDDIGTAVNAQENDADCRYQGVGVMTGGLTGEEGRNKFQEAGAIEVLDDVNQLVDWLE